MPSRWPPVRGIGERDAETRPPSRLAIALDRAAVTLNNTMSHEESKPRPLRTGRIERLEDARPMLRVDARPGVLHIEHDERAIGGARPKRTKGHGSPRRRGLDRVLDQVEHHLQQLIRVGAHARPVARRFEHHGHAALLRRGGEASDRALGQLRDRYRTQYEISGPRGGEEVLDDRIEAYDLAKNEPDALVALVPRREVAAQVLHAGRDPRQRVAQLVGDAGGEAAERRETVQLANALLHAPQAGEVDERRDGAPDSTFAVTDRCGGDVRRERRAVRPLQAALGPRVHRALFEALEELP